MKEIIGSTVTGGGFFYLDPSEYVTTRAAILAKSGAGKSYTAGVIMETLLRARLPFVVLDPVGIHWSLRLTADGMANPDAMGLVVFGGDHGDVEISRHNGGAVAEAIMRFDLSAVVDITGMGKTAAREFVRDFATHLYEKNETARHLFIEEATEFVPQTRRPDWQPAYDAVERLVRVGRNRGLGVTLISQRAAQVAKDCLTQIDLLIALRTVGPRDRAALREMFANDLEADQQHLLGEFDKAITSLANGEAYVWWPERRIFERIKVSERRSLHGGAGGSAKNLTTVTVACRSLDAIRAMLTDGDSGVPEPKRTACTHPAEIAQLRDEMATLRSSLAQARAQADKAEEWRMLAEHNQQAASVLTLLREWLGAGQTIEGTALRDMVRSEVAAQAGTPTAAPGPDVLRKKYQRQAAERIVSRVQALSDDERSALTFLMGVESFVPINRVAKGISGNDAGSTRERWSKALGTLASAGLVAVGGSGRMGRKAAVREWVARELAPHSPTDSEVEETYNAVAGLLA